jgi:hypothetical protein
MNTTDLTPLPDRPSLEQYRKQAKDFVKLAKSGDSEIRQRIKRYHPRPGPVLTPADAQLVIAREHGFESWPKFAKHIEGLTRDLLRHSSIVARRFHQDRSAGQRRKRVSWRCSGVTGRRRDLCVARHGHASYTGLSVRSQNVQAWHRA